MTAMPSELHPNQVGLLRQYLSDETRLGRLTLDISPINLYEITEPQYRKLLALIIKHKQAELNSMLFSLGAKGTL